MHFRKCRRSFSSPVRAIRLSSWAQEIGAPNQQSSDVPGQRHESAAGAVGR
jgi:hypothetical protein